MVADHKKIHLAEVAQFCERAVVKFYRSTQPNEVACGACAFAKQNIAKRALVHVAAFNLDS
jgi:hypothetical protein